MIANGMCRRYFISALVIKEKRKEKQKGKNGNNLMFPNRGMINYGTERGRSPYSDMKLCPRLYLIKQASCRKKYACLI